MITFQQYLNEVLKRDISVGDKIKNINPDCEHYGSEGTVKKVIKRADTGNDKVSNGHNTPGSDVEYDVENDTENAKPGDKLRKSLDQIKIKSKT